MLFTAKDARRGVENDEFIPFFQPLVRLQTGQLAGFEVLARWRHPVLGIVSPDQFIPIAEKEGWIGDLTKSLFFKAFAAAKDTPEHLIFAVNISPMQLHDFNLAKQIQSAAEMNEFPMRRVAIEITESALADNLKPAQTIAKDFKAMGCKIALDNFGTGHSSLLHLQSLPFDELKVDRSFVSSMTECQQSRKIVAAVVGLGQSLGLLTIAEGVETPEQAEMLLWLGCDVGQGWLFGKPMPAEELQAAIALPREKISIHKAKNIWQGISGDSLPSQRLAEMNGASVDIDEMKREHQRLLDLAEALIKELQIKV
jgi:EAL domain-containing protein (putative c-di-GMP-specific phosphodiesterase class I)